MARLIVAFRNFANAPKKELLLPLLSNNRDANTSRCYVTHGCFAYLFLVDAFHMRYVELLLFLHIFVFYFRSKRESD